MSEQGENPVTAVGTEQENTAVENQQQQQQEEVVPSVLLKISISAAVSISIPVQLQDSIFDVRQLMSELPESCYLTCYNFSWNDQILSDNVQFAQIEGFEQNPTIQVVNSKYNEKDARVHLKKFREIIDGATIKHSFAENAGVSVYESLFPQEPEKTEKNEKIIETSIDEAIKSLKETPLLSKRYPKDLQKSPPKCLQQISFSYWNPPTQQRRIQGDLFYLKAALLDGKEVHITASTLGFFVNYSTSTNFDPSPKPNSLSNTIVELLSKVDENFKNNFIKIQTYMAIKQTLETPCFALSSIPWCTPLPTPVMNAGLTEEFIANRLDSLDFPGQARDWNDEFQACKELPSRSMEERLLRDRALFRVNCDFSEAALKGVTSIVEGSILPLNPNEPEEAHMFVYNNIFFSYAKDSRQVFQNLGGDLAAHASASKDVQGIMVYNSIELGEFKETTGTMSGGLHTVLTAVVDYRGKRMVAQSIIPGILRRETNIVSYGLDNTQTVCWNEKFDSVLAKASKLLHISPHKVTDQSGNSVTLQTSADTKGIIGSDDRLYILDLYRTTPVDTNFIQTSPEEKPRMGPYPHQMTLIRMELVGQFHETKYINFLKEKIAQKKQDGADAQSVIDLESEEFNFDLSFNTDIFTSGTFTLSDEQEKLEKEKGHVKELGDYLWSVAIPGLVSKFEGMMVAPIDSRSLTSCFHTSGINMRYLGRVLQLCDQTIESSKSDATKSVNRLDFIKYLCLQEMIVRSVKHLFRRYIANVPQHATASFVAHFLNSFLGNNSNNSSSGISILKSLQGQQPQQQVATPQPTQPQTNGKDAAASAAAKSKNKNKKKKSAKKSGESSTQDVSDIESFKVTATSLWEEIRNEVKLRFLFELPASKSLICPEYLRKLPALRAFCQKVGVQITSRNYDFESKERTFIEKDIIAIYPLVKFPIPKSLDSKELFETGRNHYNQGKQQVGLELLFDSLNACQQVYGNVHPEIIGCLSNLALMVHQSGDLDSAVNLQERAIILSEKLYGLDDPETSRLYTNLSFLLFIKKDISKALKVMAYSRQSSHLIYGSDHPDFTTTESNIAYMLQGAARFSESIEYSKRVVELHEQFFGKDSLYTASSYHSMAKALSLVDEFKEGFKYEKMAYSIFSKKLDENNDLVKESSEWLNLLTRNAVQVEKIKRAAEAGVQSGRAQPNLQWNFGPTQQQQQSSSLQSRSQQKQTTSTPSNTSNASTPKLKGKLKK